MDFWEVLKARRSVRNFQPRDVPDELVERLLEAAILAPSAGNLQPWHFIVVRNDAAKRALARAAGGQGFVAEAPVAIVVCADAQRSSRGYGQRGVTLYCLQDTAAAIENLLLAVAALGLGACWVGAFNEAAAAAALKLAAHLRPVAIVPIGYPAEKLGARTPRRPWRDATEFVE
jgi:nitroreductase